MGFSSSRCIFLAVLVALSAGCALPERPEIGRNSSPQRVLDNPAAGDFARAAAIRQLGTSEPGDIVSLIIRHVDDPAATVRLQVAEALGSSGDPGAAPGLERLLEDADRNVRRAAALGLYRRGIYQGLYKTDPLTVLETVRRHLSAGIRNGSAFSQRTPAARWNSKRPPCPSRRPGSSLHSPTRISSSRVKPKQ